MADIVPSVKEAVVIWLQALDHTGQPVMRALTAYDH
jgi:hypothetical protein